MSMATTPFLNRRGVFPFCADDAPPITDPLYDAVDFSASGDGLVEAHAAFWLLELLQFTPTGTGSAGPFSFGTSLLLPSPSTTSLVSYSLSGVLGAQSLASGSIVTTRSNDPQVRVCLSAGIVTADASYALGGGGGGALRGTHSLAIASAARTWRAATRAAPLLLSVSFGVQKLIRPKTAFFIKASDSNNVEVKTSPVFPERSQSWRISEIIFERVS